MEITSTPHPALKAAAKKPSVTLESLAGARDPEKVKKEKEIQNTMQSVLSAMKSSKSDLSDQRKAAAMEKIARIKQSIQALKMSGIVDPKMVGRIAARLAKELAAAVKEYAAAGGSAASIGASASTQATQAKSAPAADTVALAENVDAPAPAETTQTVAATPAIKEETPTTKPEKGVAAYQKSDSASPAAQKSNSSDDAFKSAVRDAIDELRKLLKQNKGLVSNKNDKDKFEEAEKALRKAEQTLAAIGSGFTVPAISVNI